MAGKRKGGGSSEDGTTEGPDKTKTELPDGADTNPPTPDNVVAFKKRGRPKVEKPPPVGPDHPLVDFRTRLETGRNGVIPSLSNVVLLLSEHPDWAGVLAWNSFRHRLVFLNRPPWAPEGDWTPRDVDDPDITEVQVWFQRLRVPVEKPNAVYAAMVKVALDQSFHPMRDFLGGLPDWDGTDRLGPVLPSLLGAEPTPIHQEFVRLWMVSAVARIERPGCKADHVLTLLGPQGRLKSSALRALAGDGFFSDAPFTSVTNKDALQAMRGNWIIELEEISRLLNGRDAAEVKAFISRQQDRYRSPYGKIDKIFQRECVFAATDNNEKLLHDLTGNRRFWVLYTGQPIDLVGIERERVQLWAEALARFRRGEKWWITDEGLIAEAEALQDEAAHENPWSLAVKRFVDGGTRPIDEVHSVFDIFECERPGQRTTGASKDAKAIVSALKKLGFERVRKRLHEAPRGPGDRVWVYARPAQAIPPQGESPENSEPGRF